jgi:hypothetical protein
MFRKIAMALVAASVLTVPVLAQTNAPGDGKASPLTSAPTVSSTEKADKAITKVTKHRIVARHHRHGAKMAKSTKYHGPKMVKYAKSGTKYGKFTRHIGRGRTVPKHAFGAASTKPISKPAAKPSLY